MNNDNLLDQLMSEILGEATTVQTKQLVLDRTTLVCHRTTGLLVSVGADGFGDLVCHPERDTVCTEGTWHVQETEKTMNDLVTLEGSTLCPGCFDEFEIGVFNNLKSKLPQQKVEEKTNFRPRMTQ